MDPKEKIALHLSIRPDEPALVRNDYLHNRRWGWGPEERDGGCPIHYNEPFDLIVLAEETHYKVTINGVEYCTFRHRIPLSAVTHVSVEGVGAIYCIEVEGEISMGSPER